MRVLAKAYGEQPLERVVSGASGGVTYLLNPSTISSTGIEPESGIGFPNKYVFEFDAGLFESLQRAWVAGDAAGLGELWAKATPLTDHGRLAV